MVNLIDLVPQNGGDRLGVTYERNPNEDPAEVSLVTLNNGERSITLRMTAGQIVNLRDAL